MNSVVVRTLFSLFVPGGLVVFTTAIIIYLGVLDKSLSALVHIYPYLVAVAGMLLGWRFNRSRLIFAILVLALADRGLLLSASTSNNVGAASATVGQTVYNAIGFLLPLNLVFVSRVKERGILTFHGLVRLGLILLQVFAVFLTCRYQEWGLAAFLSYSLPHGHLLSWLPLSLPCLLSFALAFLFLTIGFIRHESVIENGFFWALLSIFLAFAVGKIGPISTIYLATAGLVLVVSVIETSHSMAFRDELTGILGRRALEEKLLQISGNFTVAMVDIDFFKKFNDRYGHEVGDQVLRLVASKLATVSGGGKPFRYGGEEFTIIFPGLNSKAAISHLEKLRKRVEQTRFLVRGSNRSGKRLEKSKGMRGFRKRAKVTISIGVAEKNEKYSSPEQVLMAADKALYRAKKAGRNQTSA
ncbi:MAG: GGDEF domain-containing protein [Deltaproteobacteria bacterium]|nr:GGDEF domain-containing protein [Deltaproteobacteria bacterium]